MLAELTALTTANAAKINVARVAQTSTDHE